MWFALTLIGAVHAEQSAQLARPQPDAWPAGAPCTLLCAKCFLKSYVGNKTREAWLYYETSRLCMIRKPSSRVVNYVYKTELRPESTAASHRPHHLASTGPVHNAPEQLLITLCAANTIIAICRVIPLVSAGRGRGRHTARSACVASLRRAVTRPDGRMS